MIARPDRSRDDLRSIAATAAVLISAAALLSACGGDDSPSGTGGTDAALVGVDTAAIAPALQSLATKKIPVVTIDTRPDQGEVFMVVRDAWRRHVACVFPKSTIVPQLTVAENLLLNRYDRGRGGLISWRSLRQRARDLLAV